MSEQRAGSKATAGIPRYLSFVVRGQDPDTFETEMKQFVSSLAKQLNINDHFVYIWDQSDGRGYLKLSSIDDVDRMKGHLSRLTFHGSWIEFYERQNDYREPVKPSESVGGFYLQTRQIAHLEQDSSERPLDNTPLIVNPLSTPYSNYLDSSQESESGSQGGGYHTQSSFTEGHHELENRRLYIETFKGFDTKAEISDKIRSVSGISSRHIEKCTIVDRAPDGKRYAYVLMTRPDLAKRVITELDGQRHKKQRLRVQLAKYQPAKIVQSEQQGQVSATASRAFDETHTSSSASIGSPMPATGSHTRSGEPIVSSTGENIYWPEHSNSEKGKAVNPNPEAEAPRNNHDDSDENRETKEMRELFEESKLDAENSRRSFSKKGEPSKLTSKKEESSKSSSAKGDSSFRKESSKSRGSHHHHQRHKDEKEKKRH